MKFQNKYLRKNWHFESEKNYLFYFFTSNIKAKENRKLRRLCKSKNINLWVLPSAFTLEKRFLAQGPCIACISAQNIGFDSFKALVKNTSTLLSYQNRAFPGSLLENFQNLKKPQNCCFKFCDIFETLTNYLKFKNGEIHSFD